jgi:hypothetical protein
MSEPPERCDILVRLPVRWCAVYRAASARVVVARNKNIEITGDRHKIESTALETSIVQIRRTRYRASVSARIASSLRSMGILTSSAHFGGDLNM